MVDLFMTRLGNAARATPLDVCRQQGLHQKAEVSPDFEAPLKAVNIFELRPSFFDLSLDLPALLHATPQCIQNLASHQVESQSFM